MWSPLLYWGVAMVALALLYEAYFCKWQKEDAVVDISTVWSREIRRPKRGPERIMVGVNSNLDMIVSATDLLLALNVEVTEPCDHSALNSVSELEQLVAFSMLHCAGVERTFTELSVFHNLTNIAATLSHVYHIGGNAALIADKIKSTYPSIEVMLVGPIGDKLKSLLHSDILTPTYSDVGGTDEVHMILEYPVGADWGQTKSTCANRIIFSHDISNSKMVALEDIGHVVDQFSPDLAVLSGAHLLGGQPQEVWTQRLKDIVALLKSSLWDIPVHWELATIGNMKFFQKLAENLFPAVNSLGLNEQELLSVAKSSNAPFDLASIPQKPGIEWVSDLLHWLMLRFSSLSGFPSILTRVHFHSLSFHIIATVKGGPWINNKEAVMAGAEVAGLQACDTDSFSPESFQVKLPELFSITKTDAELLDIVKSSRAGWAEWIRDDIHYYFSPVLVCNHPKKTVGLGDAISSLGLIYSEYHAI